MIAIQIILIPPSIHQPITNLIKLKTSSKKPKTSNTTLVIIEPLDSVRGFPIFPFQISFINNSFIIMFKIVCLLMLISLLWARDYPQYNQCDPKWKDEKLGTSSNTICQVGALVSAASIGLSGIGINQNPSTLNKWLMSNKGYVNKDDFVWASINSFGVIFQGKVPNTLLRINLDVGYLVIINVNKGQHWVLATGYNGNTIYVVDSLNLNVKSYDISAIVSGNSGVYKVPNAFSLPVMINDLQRKYLQTEEEDKR